MSDSLTQIDAASKLHSSNEQVLRNYLEQLSNNLASTCSRANIRCSTSDIKFDGNDDDWVFGHLTCDRDGLYVAHAFTGDAQHAEYSGEPWPTYTLTPVRETSLDFLQAVSRREVIEELLKKIQEEILRSSDDLRNRVIALASVAQPPERAASDEFEVKAKELGFDRISAEWREAQVNVIVNPDLAVHAAGTMVEGVCKHILDSKQISYKEQNELPKLVEAVCKSLRLNHSNGKSDPTDRITSGLNTVLHNVGTLRNVRSNAHGRGEEYVKATQMQARLAVNAAGVIVMYLLDLLSHQTTTTQ
jgi:Abortive infection C-terminus